MRKGVLKDVFPTSTATELMVKNNFSVCYDAHLFLFVILPNAWRKKKYRKETLVDVQCLCIEICTIFFCLSSGNQGNEKLILL